MRLFFSVIILLVMLLVSLSLSAGSVWLWRYTTTSHAVGDHCYYVGDPGRVGTSLGNWVYGATSRPGRLIVFKILVFFAPPADEEEMAQLRAWDPDVKTPEPKKPGDFIRPAFYIAQPVDYRSMSMRPKDPRYYPFAMTIPLWVPTLLGLVYPSWLVFKLLRKVRQPRGFAVITGSSDHAESR